MDITVHLASRKPHKFSFAPGGTVNELLTAIQQNLGTEEGQHARVVRA
jgi:hypothetical protein